MIRNGELVLVAATELEQWMQREAAVTLRTRRAGLVNGVTCECPGFRERGPAVGQHPAGSRERRPPRAKRRALWWWRSLRAGY